MSRYMPPYKVQAERVAQLVRFSNGLKSGRYVRCLIVGRPASILRHRLDAALEAGENVKLLTETEYHDAIKPKSKAEPVTYAGTQEPKNITNFELHEIASRGSDEVLSAFEVTAVDTTAGTVTVGRPKSEN